MFIGGVRQCFLVFVINIYCMLVLSDIVLNGITCNNLVNVCCTIVCIFLNKYENLFDMNFLKTHKHNTFILDLRIIVYSAQTN